MSSDIKVLLKNHPSLKYNNSTKKVKCSLSGHEMPYKEEAIKSYVNGKKYLKLKARDDKNFEKYKPHLVPSTKKYHEHQLFSVLMMTHVNKTPAHVERHVNGSKFKRRLKLWEECQRTGKEYRPPKGRRKVTENLDLRKGISSTEDGAAKDDVDEGEVSETDSMSDLYPANKKVDEDDDTEANGDKVESDEDDEDSDFEFEQLEEPEDQQETSSTTSKSPVGQKREGEKMSKTNKKKQKFS